MDESIQVVSIIDKLLSTWKDVKKKLKHRMDDLSVKHRGKHLLIEEQYRLENKANDDTSIVHVMEKKESSKIGSIMAAEFVALASCCKEAEWLKDLLINIPLWPKHMPPIFMHCDSQSTLSRAYNQVYNDVQTAFLPNRQILDGHFIINEILTRCKLKKQQAMIFKVDFAKAYDFVRWDYLDDVLISFGFGPKWRSWIRGSLSSGKASILVNGSPTTEFHLYRGLKQEGTPYSLFVFTHMESLHLSFSGQLKRELSRIQDDAFY
ncbi:RNA-directed DNA polymerase, eukaryota [Tanacetum coccineum]